VVAAFTIHSRFSSLDSKSQYSRDRLRQVAHGWTYFRKIHKLINNKYRRQWCIAGSAPGIHCTPDLSSLGARRRLGHDETKRRGRGVSLCTTTQRRHSLQRYRHASMWPIMCKYDVIHKTGKNRKYITYCSTARIGPSHGGE